MEDSQTLCDSNLILFDIGNNLLISSFSAACLSSICSLSLIAAARLSLLLSSFCFFISPAERISSAKVCILASAFSFPRSSHSHTINISDRKSVKAIYYGPDIEKRYKSHLRKVAQLRGLEEYDVSVDLDNPNFELKLTKLQVRFLLMRLRSRLARTRQRRQLCYVCQTNPHLATCPVQKCTRSIAILFKYYHYPCFFHGSFQ